MTDAHHYTDWVGSKEKKGEKETEDGEVLFFVL
jgi:hypothetical protein